MDSEAEERRAKTAIGPFVGRTDYPLTVVAAPSPEGEPSGCLTGFVTQCSFAPPRLLICISTSNHTFGVAAGSSGLAVYLLGGDRLGTAAPFGQETGGFVDKFAKCD
jgi:flavin reductase (DIM6/NTAB) family NADH-FMN oxidoreductase RutF